VVAYLESVWRACGRSRSNKASLIDDIEVLATYTRDHFLKNESVFLCAEVEQALLSIH